MINHANKKLDELPNSATRMHHLKVPLSFSFNFAQFYACTFCKPVE